MRIALDAHGGDFGLKPNLEGALLAAKKLPHEIILVGRDPEIREELRRMGRGRSAEGAAVCFQQCGSGPQTR